MQERDTPQPYINLTVLAIKMSPRLVSSYQLLSEQLEALATSPCNCGSNDNGVQEVDLSCFPLTQLLSLSLAIIHNAVLCDNSGVVMWAHFTPIHTTLPHSLITAQYNSQGKDRMCGPYLWTNLPLAYRS